MKRPVHIDRLEETMENPDLPPIALAPGTVPRASVAAARPARRSLRLPLILGVLAVAGALVALRFAGA